MEVVEQRPKRCTLAAVLVNQIDQSPLDCVFVVVNTRRLRCPDFCPCYEYKIGTQTMSESRCLSTD